jgi:hypothetical protein
VLGLAFHCVLLSVIMQSVILLNVNLLWHCDDYYYAECYYGKSHHAEYRYAQCRRTKTQRKISLKNARVNRPLCFNRPQNEMKKKSRTLWVEPRNPYLRERPTTVELLVLTTSDQLLLIMKIYFLFFTRRNFLYKEVNCT